MLGAEMGADFLRRERKWFLPPSCEGGQSCVTISTLFSFSFSVRDGWRQDLRRPNVRTLARGSNVPALAVPLIKP